MSNASMEDVLNNERTQSVLKKAFYDISTGYVSANKLYAKLKTDYPELTLKQTKQFINKQSTAQIHKEVPKDPEKFNQILALGIGETCMDLLDLSMYKSHNRGFKYILLVQDIYSRYIHGIPLKSKNGKVVLEAIKSIEAEFNKGGYRINSYAFDLGTEFVNRYFEEHTEQKKVKLFPKNPNVKNSSLATIDRMCRTIRSILNKYFSATGKLVWIDIIQDVFLNINSSVNRTIKTTPISIWKGEDINHQIIMKKPERLAIGSRVRVRKRKGVFSKGGNNFSSKVYEIIDFNGVGYSLDLKTGKYFGYELLLVDENAVDVDNEFRRKNKEKNKAKRAERSS